MCKLVYNPLTPTETKGEKFLQTSVQVGMDL